MAQQTSLPSRDVVDLLSRLVDRSLLSLDQQGFRYGMLESVRQYGAESLIATGQDAETRRRHFRFFFGLSQNTNDRIRGRHQLEWLTRYDREQDNFRAALTWAMEQPDCMDDAAEMAWELLDYWVVRCRFAEGADWFNALLQRLPEEQAEARVVSLTGLACCCRYMNDPRDMEFLQQALALAQGIGSTRGLGLVLFGQAYSLLYREDFKRGAELMRQALAYAQSVGNKVSEGHALWHLGYAAAFGDKDLERAIRLMGESLRVREESLDQRGAGAAKCALGSLRELQGQTEASVPLLIEGLHDLAETGDLHTFAEESSGGCVGLMLQGRFDDAARLLGFGDGLQELLQTKRFPFCQRMYALHRAQVKRALGEEAFAAAHRAGTAMSLESALTLIASGRLTGT